MNRFLRMTLMASLLASVVASRGGAAQVSLLPWRPVPLEVGTVVPPANPADWYSGGAWLDENTVAAGIKSSASVQIRSLDGAVQQELLNPDGPGDQSLAFGCAVHAVDGALLVMAARSPRDGGPVLHVFQRPGPTRDFQAVARVALPGTLTGLASRMRIWSESVSGGLSARQLVVTWSNGSIGHVTVLRPTGPLAWSIESFTFTLQSSLARIVGSIRGDTIALLHDPALEVVHLWRRSAEGAWGATGQWYISNAPYDNEFSYPVVMDSDNVLVGQPSHLSGIGRLAHLRFADGAWVEVGSILPEHPVPYGRWGDALGAFDDTLVITRRDHMDGLALLEVRRWRSDGTLGPGPDLIDAQGASNAFSDDLAKIAFTPDGDIVAESEMAPFGGTTQWKPWNFILMADGLDLDRDSTPDLAALEAGSAPDCNGNWVPDAADLALGLESDANGDGTPDACEVDCDGDGVGDFQQVVSRGGDCNRNHVLDTCELASGAADADGDGLPDDCGADCNRNGISDAAELAMGLVEDCDGNGVPDSCDRYQPFELGAPFEDGLEGWTAAIWFTVEPGREVIDAVDFERADSGLPPFIAIVQDRGGLGYASQVEDSDVLLVEVPFVLDQSPAPEELGGPIQRLAFRPIDLSGTVAYWVVVSNVQRRSIAPQFSLVPGSCRMRSYGFPPTVAGARTSVLGVYSSTTAAAIWPVPARCHDPADLNRDGRVNGADLGMLLSGWNSTASLLDLDGNGIVAGADLGMLLEAWGVGEK